MRKLIISMVVIVLAIVIGLVIYFNQGQVDEPVITVGKGNIVAHAEAVGYIKPRHAITIKSQVDGTVEEIYHYEG